MSVLSRAGAGVQIEGIPSDWLRDILSRLRKELGEEFWKYYATHREDVVLKKKVWIFWVDVQLKDLRGLWEILFGEAPAGSGL